MIFIIFVISERISVVLVAGGFGTSNVDVLAGDLRTKQLPNMPIGTYDSAMVKHNRTILLTCGRNNVYNSGVCLQLDDHGTWKFHSTLKQGRAGHSAVTTQTVGCAVLYSDVPKV